MILVLSKRQKKAQAEYKNKGFVIIDVTSKSDDCRFKKFSPFFPHGNIPIPGMEGSFAESVEGIWQGLKVFEKEGPDRSKFVIKNMKNIKRSSNKRGRVLGHSFQNKLLSYVDARKCIYLPSYHWVLQNKLQDEIELVRDLMNKGNNIVLLDYETNEDIEDVSKPLSHASLIKRCLM